MSNKPTYLNALLEYYGNLSDDAVAIVNKALQGANDGTLDAKSIGSDTVSLWIRGMIGPWAPFLSGSPWAIPKLQVTIQQGQTDPATGSLPWAGDPAATFETTKLTETSAGSAEIPKSKVTAKLSDDKSQLVVTVQDVSALLKDVILEGRVTNKVTAEQVAVIVAIVTPAP